MFGQPICLLCQRSDHGIHRTELIEVYVGEQRKRLQGTVEKVQASIDFGQRALADVNDTDEQLRGVQGFASMEPSTAAAVPTTNHERMLTVIRKRFDALCGRLREREAALVQSVNEYVENKAGQLHGQREELSEFLARSYRTLQDTTSALNNPNDVWFMSSFEQQLEQMKAISETLLLPKAAVTPQINITFESGLALAIQAHGVLEDDSSARQVKPVLSSETADERARREEAEQIELLRDTLSSGVLKELIEGDSDLLARLPEELRQHPSLTPGDRNALGLLIASPEHVRGMGVEGVLGVLTSIETWSQQALRLLARFVDAHTERHLPELTPALLHGVIHCLASSTVRSLNLASHHDEFEGGPAIAAALGLNTSLEHLELHNVRLDPNDFKVVAAALGIKPNLSTLRLCNCNLRTENWADIGAAIRANSTITTLELSLNKNGNIGCAPLVAALADNGTITSLNLSENEITGEGMAIFALLFKKNAVLSRVDLSNNRIDLSGCIALGDALKTNVALTSLDLASNPTSIEGYGAITAAISHNTTLIGLNVDGVSEFRRARDRQQRLRAASSSSWSCRGCTYLNDTSSATCEQCQTSQKTDFEDDLFLAEAGWSNEGGSAFHTQPYPSFGQQKRPNRFRPREPVDHKPIPFHESRQSFQSSSDDRGDFGFFDEQPSERSRQRGYGFASSSSIKPPSDFAFPDSDSDEQTQADFGFGPVGFNDTEMDNIFGNASEPSAFFDPFAKPPPSRPSAFPGPHKHHGREIGFGVSGFETNSNDDFFETPPRSFDGRADAFDSNDDPFEPQRLGRGGSFGSDSISSRIPDQMRGRGRGRGR